MREKIRSVIQSHFLDNEYKDMKPKPNVMETTSFSITSASAKRQCSC